MNDAAQRGVPLEQLLRDIRDRIDACDNGILALLGKRFALVEEVRALKRLDTAALPLRPSREITILRRLLAQAADLHVSPQLLVRLWPLIISEASLQQATITIHLPKKLFQNTALRFRIRDYYGAMPVEEAKDEAQALLQVNTSPGDICIVETGAPWVEPFMQGRAGRAEVMAVLPVLREGDHPKMLVFGHAPQEATGDDETLVISNGALPRDFELTPVWHSKIGDYRISALPGFHSAREQPLAGLIRSNPNLGLKLAGRYPSAIEI
jgi:chorismate mutase / prephenate dehydratase